MSADINFNLIINKLFNGMHKDLQTIFIGVIFLGVSIITNWTFQLLKIDTSPIGPFLLLVFVVGFVLVGIGIFRLTER